MKAPPLRNCLLFGDDVGLNQLLQYVPLTNIAGLVVAENRPQCHDFVSALAQQYSLPMFIQPVRKKIIALQDFETKLSSLEPDGLICNSYSLMLSDNLLSGVNGHAFNIHYALLPKNRGPNPVEWAIAKGEKQTGVSLHKMAPGYDTGEIIAQTALRIDQTDTWVSLIEKLYLASMSFLEKKIPTLFKGCWHSTPQDETLATINPALPAQGIEIDFSRMTDTEVYNIIRANIAPHPGARLKTRNGDIHFPSFIPKEQIPALRNKHHL